MDSLKPCPNPGCKNMMPRVAGFDRNRRGPLDLFWITCTCGVTGPTSDTVADARLLWNNLPRATPDATQGLSGDDHLAMCIINSPDACARIISLAEPIKYLHLEFLGVEVELYVADGQLVNHVNGKTAYVSPQIAALARARHAELRAKQEEGKK